MKVSSPADRARLDELGVVVLGEGAGQALVLADAGQLEDLARLRFEPRASDSLGSLLDEPGAGSDPHLARSLQSLLTQAAIVQSLDGGNRQALASARAGLRAMMHALSADQRAGIAVLAAADDDGDGLTNTEEQWWCTDPANLDSDSDLVDDSTEIAQLLAADTTNGKPFIGWPSDHPGCFDDDTDSIPDMAEVYVVGLNINRESTDGDKFDDGQEFFGITKYPGYGALPRPEDTFITANMPGWVDPPGNSPFVAAYPQIEIVVIQDSMQVTLVTEVTTGETHGVGETVSYETTHTEGTSQGVGKEESHTYSEWQEIGNSIADAVERTSYQSVMQSYSQQYSWEHSVGVASEAEYGGNTSVSVGSHVNTSIGAEVSTEVSAGLTDASVSVGASVSTELETGISSESSAGQSWAYRDSTSEQTTRGGSCGYEVSYESGQSVSVSQIHERSQVVGVGQESTQSTTITREDYEELSVTNGNQIATTEEWSTATAVDTSHAADLTFAYRAQNSGTDNARQIEGILFNIYIGGERNPISTYAGVLVGETCTQVAVNNLYPGDFFPTTGTATQCKISLTLEQLALIDQGASVRIVVADYSYGDDQQFYENAWGQGVIVEVDDGTWDGDENVDAYLIPTWGAETYQDVLRRYFPVAETADGDILTIFTPEYDANHEITGWYEHAISGRSWWNVYLSEYGNGAVIPFRDRPAAPESHVLMRFNQDTDLDHFSDRVERKLQTDLNDPNDHPNAGLVAGYYETRQGNVVRVQLALENFDTYNASGTQGMMYGLDDSVSVGNSLVGMAGLIPAGEKVLLSSYILPPVPIHWSETAQPVVSGHYIGAADNVYTFTVSGDGQVGVTPGLQLAWVDGTGASGSLDVGDTYTPPAPMPVADGIELGMGSGSVASGDRFSVSALAPRDVFSYTINQEPYTKPLIVVSYNDPEGNHRIVTPVQLDNVTDDLSPYVGDMQPAPELSILSESAFDEEGDNQIALSFVNPQDTPIVDGHLLIAYATSVTGTVVASRYITTTFLPGPNLYMETWNTDEFSPTYRSDVSYKVKVFATDSEGRPIDVAFTHFFELRKSQLPQIAVNGTTWDVGSVVQGTVHERTVTFANTGLADLWVWAGAGAPIPLRPEATMARLRPGEFEDIELTLDTAEFPIGPFAETVELRTNDPGSPIIVVYVSGVVEPASGEEATPYPVGELRPWDEYVIIPGPRAANETVGFPSSISPSDATEPIYLHNEDNAIVGLGEVMIEPVPTSAPSAPPESPEFPFPPTATVRSAVSTPHPSFPSGVDIDGDDPPMPGEGPEDIALDPDVWMASTSEWEVVELEGAIVRLPPTWQVEGLPSTEATSGYQLSLGSRVMQVMVEDRDSQSAGGDHPEIAQYEEMGYEVREVTIKGIPAWEMIPTGSDDGLCREIIVDLPTVWARFQLRSSGGESQCQAQDEFNLVVSSLQIGMGTPPPPELGAADRPDEDGQGGPSIIAGMSYNRQAVYNYCSQYWNGSNSDGYYISNGDGAHFIAHAGCAGGFPIHLCSGQGHSDSRVVNIASQRSYVKGFSDVSSVSCSSLATGDIVYIGKGTCWGWGGVVTSMSGGQPYIATHSADHWNVRYDLFYSYCGTPAIYDCVHIDNSPPGTPSMYDISNSDGDGSYTVDWSSVSGATNYDLQEQKCGGSWSTIYSGSSSQMSRSGQAPGEWCYHARACNGAGCSGWSSTKCTNVKPGTPSLYDISNPNGSGNHTVDWAGVSGVDGYTLQAQHDGGTWSTIYTGSTSQANVTGRSPGEWCYRVQAYKCGVAGNWSNIKCTTVNTNPNLPAGLLPEHGAGRLGRDLVLTWQDGGDPDGYPNPYREFQAEIWSPGTGWTASLSWTQTTTWTIAVPDDGVYLWHVEASDGANTSGWTPDQGLRIFSVSMADPNQVSMALPQPVEDCARYRIQHGLYTSFTSTATTQLVSADLPKRHYDEATLDVILVAAGSPTASFSIDIGNDGLDAWAYDLGGDAPMTVNSPDLAVALNNYLAARPEPAGTLVSIPIAISLDTTGELVLTNLALTPSAGSDPQVGPGDLAVSDGNPTETDLVIVSATVHNAGPFTATNVVASFYAGSPTAGGVLLGSDFLPQIPPSGSNVASRTWDTTGYTGVVEIFVVLDIADQLIELDEDNNSTSLSVSVRTRPDLQVTTIALDSPARQDLPVDVTITAQNLGGTGAGPQAIDLYEGDPDDGGIHIGSQAVAVTAGSSASVSIQWTPATLGPLTLYARADGENAISESDEANNVGTQSSYVGWGAPVYIDAGNANEQGYDPTIGYGYLTPGTVVNCGSQPHQTYRRESSGAQLQYQLDHLLPGRFYHLDLTFYLCTGSRTLRVLVDGAEVANPVTVGNRPTYISLLLDPALYSDHRIVVTIEEIGGGLGGPVVSELRLIDIRYCYRDSGHPAEVPYETAADGCGSLNGNADQTWGGQPYQTVRYDDLDTVRYRFDRLESDKAHQLHFTFYEGDGSGRVQSVLVDGVLVLSGVAISDTPQEMSVDVPTATYADGTIVVEIDEAVQPVISEIALEEKTVAGGIQGVVELQGRADASGAVITALNGSTPFASVATDAAGGYALTLADGTYELQIEMDRYLDTAKTDVNVDFGSTAVASRVLLLGGDANDDDVINIQDLALLGSHFGQTCPNPDWDGRADINDDCAVNILDLTLAGGNFGETSPVPWP